MNLQNRHMAFSFGGSKKSNERSWIVPLMLLGFLTMGIISGCSIWRSCVSPEEAESIRAAVSSGKTGLNAAAVISHAWAMIPVAAVLLISAFFSFGWITVPAALFMFGLSIGVQLCSLTGSVQTPGALSALASFAVPTALAVPVMLMLGRDCAAASYSLSNDRSDRRDAFARLIIRIPLYLIAVLLCAAVRSLI